MTVFITGGSSGIGRAIAVELGRRWDDVKIALFARRTEMLQKSAEEARAAGAAEVEIWTCDVADRPAYTAALRAAIEKLGVPDVLINNAGGGHRAFVEDTPEDHIGEVFGSNVHALWHGASVVLPAMLERGEGHIVTIASVAGVIPFPGNALYVAAKHAAVGFTRALRTELVGTDLEATVVLPAGVMTSWAEKTAGGSMLPLFEYESRRGAEIAAEEGVVPPRMADLMTPQEVATAIVNHLEDPVPELYTHLHTRELVDLFSGDREAFENGLSPYWRAHREGYETFGPDG